MRKLELLAPAKNLECGIAAIDHGADAVYIGAQRFGARAAAGNSVEDIHQLCRYAHQFGAKVYVTVNTLIYDEELQTTYQLLLDLAQVGVDAVLVQDMGLLEFNVPLTFHASTQTDNRTPGKVAWLAQQGFSRVVLARELSISEIADIHRQVPDVELEVFVHGALCVSYSGLCYASQHCFSRSANRGECAQFCRMKFSLFDNDGRCIERDRYLLSLKDMNQSAHLEQLAEAGATSFKIEGRLKDVGYVKNVTAAYSELLNQIVSRYPEKYQRASKGRSDYSFMPNLAKTFNRGYTTYFANGRQKNIASFDTPKAMGEYVGCVKEVRAQSFNVAGTATFANGDGLCFINSQRELVGFRVNRVENNRLYPFGMPAGLKAGMRLYRNNDQQFERLLSKPSARRKIPVEMRLDTTDEGFALTIDGTTTTMACEHQLAEKPQRDNIVRQLTKLGNTPYECIHFYLSEDFCYFIPASKLSELRQMAVDARLRAEQPKTVGTAISSSPVLPPIRYQHSQYYNIANSQAKDFYVRQGLNNPAPAYELKEPDHEVPMMQCRHCLRYALGYCVKHGGQQPYWHEPLYLQLGDGRRFPLEFDCRQCQMNVYANRS